MAVSEGVLAFEPSSDPLKAISPSRFEGLMGCRLREVWAANRVPPLLPAFPAARVGSVAHKLLQEAGEGRVGARPTVERRWEDLVGAAEHQMQRSWLERHLAPLKDSVPKFEVRRIQAIERACEIGTERKSDKLARSWSKSGLFGFEVAVSSRDGFVRGQIDAVLPSRSGPIIRDYKSGAIFVEDTSAQRDLKPEYESQLRLYAALYAESSGSWPVRLEIVPLLGPPQVVSFDEKSCLDLLRVARNQLGTVNRVLTTNRDPLSMQEELASPSPGNCNFCPYRPGCRPYQRATGTGEGWPSDVWGSLTSVQRLGNDRAMIHLQRGSRHIRVRGLTDDGIRHPALTRPAVGRDFAAFSLKGSTSSDVYLESRFSVLYRDWRTDASTSTEVGPEWL